MKIDFTLKEIKSLSNKELQEAYEYAYIHARKSTAFYNLKWELRNRKYGGN
jgi:hypothetical protein